MMQHPAVGIRERHDGNGDETRRAADREQGERPGGGAETSGSWGG